MNIVDLILSLLEKIVEKYIHEKDKENQRLMIISKNKIPINKAQHKKMFSLHKIVKKYQEP